MTKPKNFESLTHLDFLMRERARIETEMGRTVWEARRAGHSWAAVGHYLNISKQAAQKKYANLECYCGCGGLEADCATPVAEGPARDLTDAEEEREALGEWAALDAAQHGTPERKAKAIAEFEAAAARANQDNPWEEPKTDDYGTTPVDLEDDQDEDNGPETRVFCDCCMSNIGKEANKGTKKGTPDLIERFLEQHAKADNGKCLVWNAQGLTKPYYLPTDRPWQIGWHFPEDRRASFGK